MPVTVSLREVIFEMDVPGDIGRAYLNPKTGEVITITEEDLSALEYDDPDRRPLWHRESLPKIREVIESDDFLPLPDKHEIHHWDIMRRFCGSVEDQEQREDLLNAISGRGAFRYFRDTIHHFGIEDDWYRFRDETIKRIAIDWLEAHGVPFE